MADDLSRRALLRCGAACALAACGKFVDQPVAIEAGAPTKGLLSVPTARIPELASAGGSVLLHLDATDFLGRPVSVLVANTAADEVTNWRRVMRKISCFESTYAAP